MCLAGVADPVPCSPAVAVGTGEAGVEQGLGIWLCFVLNASKWCGSSSLFGPGAGKPRPITKFSQKQSQWHIQQPWVQPRVVVALLGFPLYEHHGP